MVKSELQTGHRYPKERACHRTRTGSPTDATPTGAHHGRTTPARTNAPTNVATRDMTADQSRGCGSSSCSTAG
jgi:hypothetical protein